MFDIDFPPASTTSKLSACPTEKIPQTTDWIYQDFLSTVLTGDHATATLLPPFTRLFPHEQSNLPYYKEQVLEQQHSLFKHLHHYRDNEEEEEEEEEEDHFTVSSIHSDDDTDLDASDSEDPSETTGRRPTSVWDDDSILEETIPPVLIESNISSSASSSTCTFTSTTSTTTTKEGPSTVHGKVLPDKNDHVLCTTHVTKRKSNSSLHSFKSMMNDVLFPRHKKSKTSHPVVVVAAAASSSPVTQEHPPYALKKKSAPMAKTMSRKLFYYLKHHRA
ncbi:hypothetical protein BDF20DRAFT_517135 [Mycotypha africana]|uniref:uncharacterized protein n=1 Tax=Mycotypha africana TaxID=64632 RepID=UPI0023013FCB|nr:uncharacterized protein BDF20DRAFT_517135 [Mycotypha africana]KAI8979570.1 hypothetical protein BDF20DRAFT_517135 [Mycotypha africana]